MNSIFKLFTALLLSVILLSCGYRLDNAIIIDGDYYLIPGAARYDFAIAYYDGDGTYTVRIPNKVIEFGFNDRYVVGKVRDDQDAIYYYIIDRDKDSDSSLTPTSTIGPIRPDIFRLKWAGRINIPLEKIKTTN